MKKQYDTTRLTDELKNSVFFQQPQQDTPTTPPQRERKQAALATSQQVTVSTKPQDDMSFHQQPEKAGSHQASLATKQHHEKATQQLSSKALKRFTSYLQEPTLKALKLVAVQRDMNDYEVLQEAVEQYLAREANENQP